MISLNQIRSNGEKYFLTHGLPNKKNEDWKYTSLKTLTVEALQSVEASRVAVNVEAEINQLRDKAFINIVFVDGVFKRHLSDKFPQVLHIQFISENNDQKIRKVVAALKKARNRATPVRQDSLEALNSARMNTGVAIEVLDGKVVPKPVHLIFYSNNSGATYPKILIKVGKNSQLDIVETYAGGEEASVTNSVSEIYLATGSKMSHGKAQIQQLNSTAIHCHRFFVDASAQLESHLMSTGSSLARHNLDVFCIGSGAMARVNGVTLSRGEQHVDNHTNIEHVVGSCETHQLYKSILNDKSQVVFNGRVHIRADAQKASSDQLNNNLLLSSLAEADSKPQLEIYADDVKATHGSTVGQMDAEELFYFLSRGIAKEKALEMMSLGFAQDVLDRVSKKSIRQWMSQLLAQEYNRNGRTL